MLFLYYVWMHFIAQPIEIMHLSLYITQYKKRIRAYTILFTSRLTEHTFFSCLALWWKTYTRLNIWNRSEHIIVCLKFLLLINTIFKLSYVHSFVTIQLVKLTILCLSATDMCCWKIWLWLKLITFWIFGKRRRSGLACIYTLIIYITCNIWRLV